MKRERPAPPIGVIAAVIHVVACMAVGIIAGFDYGKAIGVADSVGSIVALALAVAAITAVAVGDALGGASEIAEEIGEFGLGSAVFTAALARVVVGVVKFGVGAFSIGTAKSAFADAMGAGSMIFAVVIAWGVLVLVSGFARGAAAAAGRLARWLRGHRDLRGGLPGRASGRGTAWGAGWQAMRLAAYLMPPSAGRRWLDEAESFLFEAETLAEVDPALRRDALPSYLAGVPRVIAQSWATVAARQARIAGRRRAPR